MVGNVVSAELRLHTGDSPDIDCLVELFEVFEGWTEGDQDQLPGIANWTERTNGWFSSSEHGNAFWRPRLTVEYTTP